jgi:hypothetical protein
MRLSKTNPTVCICTIPVRKTVSNSSVPPAPLFCCGSWAAWLPRPCPLSRAVSGVIHRANLLLKRNLSVQEPTVVTLATRVTAVIISRQWAGSRHRPHKRKSQLAGLGPEEDQHKRRRKSQFMGSMANSMRLMRGRLLAIDSGGLAGINDVKNASGRERDEQNAPDISQRDRDTWRYSRLYPTPIAPKCSPDKAAKTDAYPTPMQLCRGRSRAHSVWVGCTFNKTVS